MADQAPEPWQRLDGKVVMVTGASSGIGYDLCIDLARAGCRVIAAARRIERLKSLCDQISNLPASSASSSSSSMDLRVRDSPVQAVAVQLDVTADDKAIAASVRRAWDAFGRIDALINNAGVRGTVKLSLDLAEEEWNSTLRTNLTGTWLVSKHVGIHMRDSKIGGCIINISSIGGINRGQLPGGVAYGASKAAVNNLTKTMALELGAYNIRVNSINPGLFRSEITQALMEKDWIHEIALKIVPLREHGTIDPALTALVKYLIHDSSEYVTGNNFIADSGVTLPGIPIFSSL